MERTATIIRTSVIGIVVNVILVTFKLIIGTLSHSIAIILDAINNLTDALSSLITIVGTKLATKAPDKKHPFGYGRIEYLTSIIIAVLILSAGLTSLKESFVKVIHPESASYTTITLVVIITAIIAKYSCGKYVKSMGEKLNAATLIASGSDAYFDAVLSFGTLVTALVSIFFHLNLEGIVGCVISLFIIKAGVEMASETLNDIIGIRADQDFTKQIKARIREIDGVNGAYDLTLHNYGPTQMVGSVHVEVDDTTTAKEITHISKHIARTIFEEYGVALSVGIYASNSSGEVLAHREHVKALVMQFEEIIGFHGFYIEEETKHMSFDCVIQFGQDQDAIYQKIMNALKEDYGDYQIDLHFDLDYSD